MAKAVIVINDITKPIEGDYIVGVERGALFLTTSNQKMDYAISDFDSITPRELETLPQDKIKVLPLEKDDTDTEAAIKHCLELGHKDITVFVDSDGTRPDHLLSLIMLCNKYPNLVIQTPNSSIKSIKGKTKIDDCLYFSLYPVNDGNIKITGAKFNLDQKVSAFESKLISNEPYDECYVDCEVNTILIQID